MLCSDRHRSHQGGPPTSVVAFAPLGKAPPPLHSPFLGPRPPLHSCSRITPQHPSPCSAGVARRPSRGQESGVIPARSCMGGGVEGAPPSGGPVGRGCSRGQLPPLERELISSGPGPQARAHSGSRAQRGLSRAPGTSQGQSSPREQGPEVASSGWAPCLDPAGMLTGTEALAGQVGVLGQGQGILTGGDCDVSPSACPCTCA